MTDDLPTKLREIADRIEAGELDIARACAVLDARGITREELTK